MEFFKDININKKDLPFILFLLVFTVIITIQMIIFNNQIGIYCSDVFIYLLNALNFAGINLKANSVMYLSPTICFCTSLLFRLGYVNVNAIYIVTGTFAIFGITGFYFLLKYKFNKILSLIGSILLFSLSLNLLWLANGTLDIPAISMSIWTILFFVLAVDKNPKYYFLALPFFVLSFFTRLTTVLILAPMLVYFLGKHDIFKGLDNLISDKQSFYTQLKNFIKSKEAKKLLKSIIVSLILSALFLCVIYHYTHSLSFLSLSSNLSSGAQGRVIDSAYTIDIYYYITNFLSFLFANQVIFFKLYIPTLQVPSLTSYLVMFITLFGLAIGLYRFKNKENIKTNSNPKSVNKRIFKTKNFNLILKILFLLILVISLLTMFKVSSVVSMLLVTFDIIILNKLLEKYEIPDLNFHLMMLTWFLIYLIPLSYIYLKVNRYILTVMPAFVYFFILGLYYIGKQWNYDFKISKHKINTSQILAILLILCFVFSAFNFTNTVNTIPDTKSSAIISDYLKHYDPNYSTKEIGVYNQRPFTWFLKMKLFGITKENRDYLTNSNITYYISNSKADNLTNYHLLKNQGKLYLYERN